MSDELDELIQFLGATRADARAQAAEIVQGLTGTDDGIAQLAHAAKAHGVRRFVAVTTASAGSPWSPAALFLNLIHHGSVKEKWRGEQAVRGSGLDYVIIRPYGLGTDGPPPPGARGIEWTQGRETAGGSSRRIHRDDVATLCHEALLCDPSSATARAPSELHGAAAWFSLRG